MSDFYTPVEINRQPQSFYLPEELQDFTTDLFRMTLPKVESLEDHQRNILQWFKKIPLLGRQLMMTYTNKQFVCLVRKMYQCSQECVDAKFSIRKDQQQNFYFCQVDNRHSELQQKAASQDFMSQMAICTRYTYCDSICPNESLLEDAEELFKYFQRIQNGISHELTREDCEQMECDNGENLFYDRMEAGETYKNVANWVADVLTRNISINYFRGKNQEQVDNFRNKAKNYSRLWKEINKQQMFQRLSKTSILTLIEEHTNFLKIRKEFFPTIYVTSEPEMKRMKQVLLECDDKIIISKLKQMTIEESFQEFNYYRVEIGQEIEARINLRLEQPDRKKSQLTKKKHKREKQSSPKLAQIHSSNTQVYFDLEQEVPLKKNSSCIDEIPKMEIKEDKRKPKSRKPQFRSVRVLVENQNASDTTTDPKDDSAEDIVTEIAPSVPTITNLLEDISSKVEKDAHQVRAYKQVALNRVAYVLGSMHLSCQCYGSTSCGLSLRESDLDISVDPSIVNFFYLEFCDYREKMIRSLLMLRNIFQGMSWVSEIIIIPNASRAHPNIFFEHAQCGKRLNIGKMKEILEFSVMIDITIEPYINMAEVSPHLGLAATQWMKDWLSVNDHLGKIVLVLKLALRSHDMHKAYNGGFSSFMVMLIVVSSFKHTKTEGDLGDKFLQVLKFIDQLDENTVVDVNRDDPVIHLSQGTGLKKLVLVNPLNGKNVSENCYQLEEIKAMLRRLKETGELGRLLLLKSE